MKGLFLFVTILWISGLVDSYCGDSEMIDCDGEYTLCQSLVTSMTQTCECLESYSSCLNAIECSADEKALLVSSCLEMGCSQQQCNQGHELGAEGVIVGVCILIELACGYYLMYA